MTERPSAGDQTPPEQGPESSVMGGLPRSRPSIRSPRRDAEQRKRAASGGAGREATAGDPATTDTASRSHSAEAGGAPGLEDVARAGVSAAAGAAGLGLRIAGRAASALREALERR